ncbi:FAD binding domain-containing protein [Aspergillus lucknowensis]|uniref:FAD binding domain-containing protein n=1 Tax=Aspergillus lucknowensis TaxID=176173 RepID=A0ABR4LIV8_9EURO
MPERPQILIVGAGPIGLTLSYQLSRLGIPCTLFEKSHTSTQWPKMDYTNARSMEIFRLLGLADAYRAQEGAVRESVKFESIFVTGFRGGGDGGRREREWMFGKWSVGSVREQRACSVRVNDGSFPLEPGQRCSQVVFERWMRGVVAGRRGVEFRVGWEYVSHVEDGDGDGVRAVFVDDRGQRHEVVGEYLVGCDGGRSRVRDVAGIQMVGGMVSPMRFYLVHFRSAQLARDSPFGEFWHAFPVGGGFIINQDGKDTFTAHYPLPPATEPDISPSIDPYEAVYRVLGGYSGVAHRITIDEILVHSRWQPSFAIAERYATQNGRVLLAGDAAHHIPPHGGYGMNSGIVDAFDLGWRLAALVKGYGGRPLLIEAYTLERRRGMLRALLRSHRHLTEHLGLADIYARHWDVLAADSAEGVGVRALIERYLTLSGPDTTDFGLELDLRYDFSPGVVPDMSAVLPVDVKRYVPSTRPGSRAPHVFLKGGRVSVYDLFGKEWTLVQFVRQGETEGEARARVHVLLDAARRFSFPLKHVLLRGEDHVRGIWERDLVLVRPDTHVAWRADEAPGRKEAEEILLVVSGKMECPGYEEPSNHELEEQFIKTAAALGGPKRATGARL